MNSWSNIIRGRAIRNGKLFEYKLQTLAVPDADAASSFQYSVHSVSLTVTEKFIPEGYTQQKVASSSSATAAAGLVFVVLLQQ